MHPLAPTPDQPALQWAACSDMFDYEPLLRAHPPQWPQMTLFIITGITENREGTTGSLSGALIPDDLENMPLLAGSPIHTLKRLAEEFLARFLSRMAVKAEPTCHRCHGHGTVILYPLHGGEECLPCPVCHPPVALPPPGECRCRVCRGQSTAAKGLHITFTLPKSTPTV